MNEATLAISIIWVFLFIYSIAGSIDFGAGFWAMVYGTRKNSTRAAVIANRFLSPSWKITNVFLVLFVVALVHFFPRAMYMLATLLLVPVSLVLILLTIRSTFMVYAHSSDKYASLLNIVSGVTGLVIPGLLLSLLPITLGGFIAIVDGVPQLLFGKLMQSPTLYAHIGFGLSTELFLSALFLADYAREAEDDSTYRTYRRIAINMGPANLLLALLTVLTFAPEASWIVRNIEQQWLWFALSLGAFAFGYSSLWWAGVGGKTPGRPRIAFVAVVIQYALASFAYGSAHMPYIVYPYITVEQGFTNPAMFRSLLVSYAVSTAILVPVFYWFWKLFMKDKRYLKQE
jgi:cytochrome d ubiquinol oxidase subunit II